MNAQQILDYCLGKPGGYLSFPFGAEPVCVRIGKRIFAQVFLSAPRVTLKCDPLYGLAKRNAYPEHIKRGYHCPPLQQPYNNTITLDETIPDEEWIEMADHSYLRALSSLTQSERVEAVKERPQDEN